MAGFTMADYRRQMQNTPPRQAPQPRPTAKRADVGNAFWINPYGKILDIGHGKHITSMTQAPEKFGLSLDDIKSAHAKHGEPMGIEGKAREELIQDAMRRGFMHIRLYPGKFWAVNVWDANRKTKKALSTWAEKAMDHPGAGKHMPVRITSIKDGQTTRSTVQDLYYGMDENIEGYEPMFVESVDDFDELHNAPTFKEFLIS